MFSNYFVRIEGHIPLNNAALCPLNKAASSVMIETIGEFHTPHEGLRIKWAEKFHNAHVIFSNLIGCDPKEVVFLPNVATAVTLVASSLSLSPKDRILVIDQEYASNAYPWHEIAQRTGASLDIATSGHDLSINQDELENMICEQTKIIAVSWVQFQTGTFLDLNRLAKRAHEAGALLLVDTTQGLGVSPFSFHKTEIDFVTGSMHKWIGGPTGLAYLAIRSKLIPDLKPIAVGSYSFGQSAGVYNPDAQLLNRASRFLSGTPPLIPIVGAAAAAQTLLDNTITVTSRQALSLAKTLHEGLEELGHQVISPLKKISPIVTFVPKQGLEKASQQLKLAGIFFAPRAGGIRLSPHAFNTRDDIERALNALKSP